LLLNKIRKGRLDLIRITRIQQQKAHSERTCRSLHLCRFCLCINRVGWVAEVSNRRGCGHGFMQKFKALRDRFDKMKVEASDISARLVETADEADLDRIGALHENNRDRLGGRFG